MVLRNTPQEDQTPFDYGALTLFGRPFQTSRLNAGLVTSRQHGSAIQICPITPHPQRLPAITRIRFRLFPVRSPLLGESQLMSFPAGTEMFHFPAFPTESVQTRLKRLD